MSLCCAQVMNTNVGLYCKLRAARLHQCKLRKQSYSKVLFRGQISFLTRCKNLAKFMASSPCAFHFFIIRSQRYGMGSTPHHGTSDVTNPMFYLVALAHAM